MSEQIITPVAEKGFLDSFRENPWKPASFVLLVAVIGLIIFGGFGKGVTGNAVSESTASENLVNFINAQGTSEAKVDSIVKEDSLYKVMLDVDGQKAPVYVTLDGKYAVPQPIPLTGDAIAAGSGSNVDSAPQEVPKSDKPKVELFVMSYCPYGTQMEKGFLPVVAALGEKADFKIRYTHFTLHGEKEDTENFRQMCIREEQPSKFYSYIQCTLNSTDPYNPADVNACMKNLGIDTAKVDSCIKTKAAGYYQVDSDLSEGYKVQGSPTLVINGVQSQSGRSPDAILKSVCSAFNNAPAECSSLQLSTASPSAGFGYNANNGADSAAVQCGV